jgi:hypothetical protein
MRAPGTRRRLLDEPEECSALVERFLKDWLGRRLKKRSVQIKAMA